MQQACDSDRSSLTPQSSAQCESGGALLLQRAITNARHVGDMQQARNCCACQSCCLQPNMLAGLTYGGPSLVKSAMLFSGSAFCTSRRRDILRSTSEACCICSQSEGLAVAKLPEECLVHATCMCCALARTCFRRSSSTLWGDCWLLPEPSKDPEHLQLAVREGWALPSTARNCLKTPLPRDDRPCREAAKASALGPPQAKQFGCSNIALQPLILSWTATLQGVDGSDSEARESHTKEEEEFNHFRATQLRGFRGNFCCCPRCGVAGSKVSVWRSRCNWLDAAILLCTPKTGTCPLTLVLCLFQAHNGGAEEFYRNLVGGVQKPVDAAAVASTPSAPPASSRAARRQAGDLLLCQGSSLLSQAAVVHIALLICLCRNPGFKKGPTLFAVPDLQQSAPPRARPQGQAPSHDTSERRHQQLGESNVGFQLLQKAGWRSGQGLGASEQGHTEPLAAWHQQGRAGIGVGSAPQLTVAGKEAGSSGQGSAQQQLQQQATEKQKKPVPDVPEEFDTKVRRHQQVGEPMTTACGCPPVPNAHGTFLPPFGSTASQSHCDHKACLPLSRWAASCQTQ